MRKLSMVATILTLTAQAVVVPSASAVTAASVRTDFDNDGYADLVVPIPGDRVSGQLDAGSVAVWYGSATGVRARRNELWNQATFGIVDNPERGDFFGESTAAGDFDGDGYDDLAIGVPGEDLNGKDDAGMVHVLYGSAEGLRLANRESWNARTAGAVRVDAYGEFGFSLVAGDLDDDGRDDLAIGQPGYRNARGRAYVLRGVSAGLSRWNRIFELGLGGLDMLGWEGPGDAFGYALAIGDTNGDGLDDLAISAPFIDYVSPDSGVVGIVRGRTVGPSVHGAKMLTPPSSREYAALGVRLKFVVADRKRPERRHLLVVGPGYDGTGLVARGYWDSTFGFVLSQSWALDVPLPPGSSPFAGYAMAQGDFNGDGYLDAATSAPSYAMRRGEVVLCTSADHDFVIQWAYCPHVTARTVGGTRGVRELFGFGLVADDFDGDGFDDLAIGAPRDAVGTVSSAGSVGIIYGSATGLTGDRTQMWTQASPGMIGTPTWGDALGVL